MEPTESKIASLLLSRGLIDQFQYSSARDHQGQAGGKFHLVVVELGYVHEEQMAKILAGITGFQSVKLSQMQPTGEALDLLPGLFCEERIVYPCAVRDGGTTLWLAMADPTDVKTRSEAEVKSGLRVRPLVGMPSEIREAVRRDYGGGDPDQQPSVVGAIDLSLQDDELEDGEFKVTDMSGKTAVRHVGDIRIEGSSREPGASGPATRSGDGEQEPGVSPDHVTRLERLLQNQRKGERIIRGLYQLCIEKGFFSAEEFQERIKK